MLTLKQCLQRKIGSTCHSFGCHSAVMCAERFRIRPTGKARTRGRTTAKAQRRTGGGSQQLKETAGCGCPGGQNENKIISEGKTYVEKSVVEEKLPVYDQQRGSELKLVLGGFIQINAEGGDAFAFNGNFGQTAIKDRFRLRRARINLTGDYAEQFDFKMEGDFANSDGLSGNRLAFEATDIWINWHQFAAAQIKAGQYKAPFRLEQLTPDTSLYTIERSLPTNAITPGTANRRGALGQTFHWHLA